LKFCDCPSHEAFKKLIIRACKKGEGEAYADRIHKRAECKRWRNQLDTKGHVVLPGLFTKEMYAKENEFPEAAEFKDTFIDEVQALFKYYEKRIPKASHKALYVTTTAKNNIWAVIRDTDKNIKDPNGTRTDSRLVTRPTETNEKVETKERLKLVTRCSIEVVFAIVFEMLNLRHSTFRLKANVPYEYGEIHIPDTGCRILATLRDCERQIPHVDYDFNPINFEDCLPQERVAMNWKI